MDYDLTQTDIAAIDPDLCWSRGSECVSGGGAVHVEGVRAQAGAGPALLASDPRALPLQVQTSREHRLGALLLAHLRHTEGLNLELCSAPSVPQPVVQSRRRPLLGPSPG